MDKTEETTVGLNQWLMRDQWMKAALGENRTTVYNKKYRIMNKTLFNILMSGEMVYTWSVAVVVNQPPFRHNSNDQARSWGAGLDPELLGECVLKLGWDLVVALMTKSIYSTRQLQVLVSVPIWVHGDPMLSLLPNSWFVMFYPFLLLILHFWCVFWPGSLLSSRVNMLTTSLECKSHRKYRLEVNSVRFTRRNQGFTIQISTLFNTLREQKGFIDVIRDPIKSSKHNGVRYGR